MNTETLSVLEIMKKKNRKPWFKSTVYFQCEILIQTHIVVRLHFKCEEHIVPPLSVNTGCWGGTEKILNRHSMSIGANAPFSQTPRDVQLSRPLLMPPVPGLGWDRCHSQDEPRAKTLSLSYLMNASNVILTMQTQWREGEKRHWLSIQEMDWMK